MKRVLVASGITPKVVQIILKYPDISIYTNCKDDFINYFAPFLLTFIDVVPPVVNELWLFDVLSDLTEIQYEWCWFSFEFNNLYLASKFIEYLNRSHRYVWCDHPEAPFGLWPFTVREGKYIANPKPGNTFRRGKLIP